MPTNYLSVRLPMSEADILADLYAVEADLEHVIGTCAAAIRLSNERFRDPFIVESLVCAALVRYFRCFSQSPRLGLRHEEIGSRSKRVRESHAWFRGLRDRFVAHCINPFEHVWVSAALAVRDGVPQPVQSLSRGSHRMALGATEAASISQLAEHALQVVRRKAKPEYKKVLRLVQKMPPPEVHKLVSQSYPRVNPMHVNRTRRQTRPNPSLERTSTGKALGPRGARG